MKSKPKGIGEIEEYFNIHLEAVPLETASFYNGILKSDKSAYVLNDKGEVLALTIHDLTTIDIYILKEYIHPTSLYQVSVISQNIADFTYLKEFKNLNSLALGGIEVIDITLFNVIKNLNSSELSELKISDFTFLNELKNLNSLCLMDLPISDFSILKKLNRLTSLSLSNKLPISDFTFLKGLKSLISLDLSHNQISDISILKGLNKLTSLDLNNNKISYCSHLKKLINLTYLDLSSNSISKIPILKKIENLTFLDLSHNEILDISNLEGLKSLTSLNLGYNKISDFSILKRLKKLTSLVLIGNDISDASTLKEVNSLTDLNLAFNQISNISFLKELKKLTSLNLSENKISDISFLKELKKLKSLELCVNKISDASVLEGLKNLTDLDLLSNKISDISFLKELKNLTSLNLSHNQISNIFDLKGLLNNLDYLYISGNPTPITFDHSNNLDLLKAYIGDCEKELTSKRQIKLLFIGDSCVGKSTLLKHLKELKPPNIVPINSRTEGIELDIWRDKFPDYTINVWDFGGQEILHNTHRLFLGERAIYVLVWCNQEAKKCSETEVHPLSYWLDFIADYGRKSIVLLVENIIQNKISNEFPDEVALQKLIEHYKSKEIELIPTHYKFDCLNDTLTIEGFRDVIKSNIKRLQSIYPIENYPANWFELQKALEKEKTKNRYITLKRYYELAKPFNLSDPKVLLSYFDQTGGLGYFPNLNDLIVLQMAWILDAIYASLKLRDNPLAYTKGKVKKSDFDLMWKNYSDWEKVLFQSYMIKSNLMAEPPFNIKRQYQYIIPALFEEIKSRDHIKWEEKEHYIAIKFRFIFGAIMQQLQVRILNYCNYNDEESLFKNYITFTDEDKNDGYVEMKVEKKELRIYSESPELEQIILNEINIIYPLDRVHIFRRTQNGEKEIKPNYRNLKLFNTRKQLSESNQRLSKQKVKVFVTYSWTDKDGKEDKEHQKRVKKFVDQLRMVWDIDATLDLYQKERNFIVMEEKNLVQNDKVIIILSEGYKKKASEFGESGVYNEYAMIRNDIKSNPSKYITVAFDSRKGDIYPLGLKGDETIVIKRDLVETDLPNEQNKLLSKLKDDRIWDPPPLGGFTPRVRKKKL